jgi:aspartate 1-decarboxylase
MQNYLHVLKSKIHRATVTQAELEYFGSITIDEVLLKAAGIFPFEKVLITNIRNGSRLETYTLKGEAHSGIICLNGPSAHLVSPGDEILIMAFSMIPEEKASQVEPIVVFPDKQNRIKEILKLNMDSVVHH